MAIACAYCGGAHDAPAEVKACWARHEAGEATEPASVAPARAGEHPRAAASPTTSLTTSAAARIDLGPASTAPPASLGRHVVVLTGASVPVAWADATRTRVSAADLDQPGPLVTALRAAAHLRSGLVLELDPGIDLVLAPDAPPATAVTAPAYELGPRFELLGDELHHLVWSNAVDLRDPDRPRFWLVDAAVGRGATAGGPADVVRPDGSPCWLDGGPVRFTPAADGVAVVAAVAVEHGSLDAPVDNDSPADLAPDQLAAVTHGGGAARIIAPAGSGKTRVLTERARHLLTSWRLPPGAVSLVAFNKRAQEEMRERTADLPGLQVRTLNAIALAVLNGTPPFARRPRRFETIDEPEVRRIIGDLVSFPRRRNTDPVAPWIEALGQIRLGLLDPDEVEAHYGGDVDGLARIWPSYRAALERRGAVDFDGQIHGAIEVLLTDPAARAAAQRACRVLLVDEFQDLTPAHLLLVRLLAAPGGAVFGVGDDDQTIYGYNGADPGWLIDFAALFPGAGAHPLEVNYRCPADVVDAADRLLRHNRRRVPKVIRAAAADGPSPGWSVVTSDDPVGDTLAAVTGAVGGPVPTDPADVVVLTRVNALLAPVQVALAAAGVPVSGGVGLEFTERTAVRAVLAWLRIARGHLAPDDLGEALRRPSRPLHPRVAGWVTEQRDIPELRRLAARLNEPRECERVDGFADDIEQLQALASVGAPVGQIVDVLVDEMGLGGAVATLDANRRGMNRSAQGDDLTAVRQLAARHHDLGTFESWLRGHLATRRDPEGVVLSTVHRVKGQEWPVVVVHLADADQYPHRLADDVEEERRLFHVALTRASRAAFVVTGSRPSPFVAELTAEPPDLRPEPPSATARGSRTGPSGSANRPAPAGRGARGSDAELAHPLLDRDHLRVAVGMELDDQGSTWTVVEVAADGVVARQGSATRRFPFGRRIRTAGKQHGVLVAADEVPSPTVRAYELLRVFRDGARGSKPAYTVFDDKTLVAIAVALPTSLDEVARVRGVGPAKLEQYGSEVLDLVEQALTGDEI